MEGWKSGLLREEALGAEWSQKELEYKKDGGVEA